MVSCDGSTVTLRRYRINRWLDGHDSEGPFATDRTPDRDRHLAWRKSNQTKLRFPSLAGGILNSINCDATGKLPIEAGTDLVLHGDAHEDFCGQLA